jgi:hypothetical protein
VSFMEDMPVVDVSIRHAEPDDAEAIHRILSSPLASTGTLQLPLQSVEGIRTLFFSETREELYRLVVCVGEGRTRKVVAESPRGYAKNMTKRGSGQVPCGSKGKNSARLGSEVNRGQGVSAI